MNAKNAKSLSAALILSLAAVANVHAAEAPRVERIVDLPAVTVRPDANLRAELASARVDHVVDLPAVTVRPDAALRTELAAQAMVARIVDLPAVYVRPTAQQAAERAAIVAAERTEALTAQLATSLLNETVQASVAR